MGNVRVNCLKTLKKLSMCLPGKTPSTPSVPGSSLFPIHLHFLGPEDFRVNGNVPDLLVEGTSVARGFATKTADCNLLPTKVPDWSATRLLLFDASIAHRPFRLRDDLGIEEVVLGEGVVAEIQGCSLLHRGLCLFFGLFSFINIFFVLALLNLVFLALAFLVFRVRYRYATN